MVSNWVITYLYMGYIGGKKCRGFTVSLHLIFFHYDPPTQAAELDLPPSRAAGEVGCCSPESGLVTPGFFVDFPGGSWVLISISVSYPIGFMGRTVHLPVPCMADTLLINR